MTTGIQSETLDFLQDLALNNDRDWFNEHKPLYRKGLEDFKAFIQGLKIQLMQFDEIERSKIFRIYRDIRFSKDKTPYKTHFSAHFVRSGKFRRGGFYFQISPEKVFVAGGFWKPERKDLEFIRQGIAADSTELRKAINESDFKKRFGALGGEELKTAPRGYDKDHEEVDLLRKKQFVVSREYPAKLALNPGFVEEVVADYRSMIPMFTAITDFLLFDGNGQER
ncbi:DUF2461 domain-containing protein [Membranihabitans maritimus]|uniref:DUF2461 domain-containing protein n=1 Tax=Membranihabitans maritimus TaxID=2904244 RepID=UPI001F2918B6|nr:DUF2461 domain-containing protein [Membranihabitans maritimus]